MKGVSSVTQGDVTFKDPLPSALRSPENGLPHLSWGLGWESLLLPSW